MATLKEITDKVDGWMETIFPLLITRQDQYFKDNKIYWQGLLTHLEPPKDNVDTKATLLTRKPEYIKSTWKEFFPEIDNVDLPCSLIIDNYHGPKGHGWDLCMIVGFEGKRYIKYLSYGEERDREKGWIEFIEDNTARSESIKI